MLFLYRPRQTWMPFAMPRNRTQQAAYNRQLQEKFASTRRVAPAVPATQHDLLSDLKELASSTGRRADRRRVRVGQSEAAGSMTSNEARATTLVGALRAGIARRPGGTSGVVHR